MLWGLAGVAAGMVAGWAAYRFVLSQLEIGLPTQLAVAFFGGLVVYLVARWIAKAALSRLFEIDGPLHRLADGFPAALISLGPSLITILVLATGIRVSGTLFDLRRYEYVTTPGADLRTTKYPKRPATAEWRDGIESLPGLRDILDWVDPLGRLPERQMTALLIVSKKLDLFRHLSENTEAQPIVSSPAFQNLLNDKVMKELNAKGERVQMLRHPDIRAACLIPDMRSQLAALELHLLVDEFLLSPEQQSIIESYRRSPEEKADQDAQ